MLDAVTAVLHISPQSPSRHHQANATDRHGLRLGVLIALSRYRTAAEDPVLETEERADCDDPSSGARQVARPQPQGIFGLWTQA